MKTPVRSLDHFRCIQLDPPEVLAEMSFGESMAFEDRGFVLTIDAKEPEVLIEQLRPGLVVKVEGTQLFDVGIVKPGQRVRVDDNELVVLDEKRVFVNDAFNGAVCLGTSNYQTFEDAKRTSLLGKSIFFVSIVFILASSAVILIGKDDSDRIDQGLPTSVYAVNEKALPLLPESSGNPEATSAVRDKDSHRPINTKIVATKVKPIIKAKGKQHQIFEEYLLEARFDPDGARKKIRVLLEQLPEESDLAKHIKAYLRQK